MNTDWEHLPSRGRRGQQMAYGGAGLLTLVALGSILFVSVNPFGPGGAKVQTTAGFAQMVADARNELGTSEVLEASLYESYAIVEVPVQGSARRTVSYRYAGDFNEVFSESQRDTDETTLINLDELDTTAVFALLKTAPNDVGLPDGAVSNVTIRMGAKAGSLHDKTQSVYVQVDTEFGESGYVQTDLSGRVINVDPGDD